MARPRIRKTADSGFSPTGARTFTWEIFDSDTGGAVLTSASESVEAGAVGSTAKEQTEALRDLLEGRLNEYLINNAYAAPEGVTTPPQTTVSVTQMAGGTGATNTTFWRGDGTWATPAGGGGSSPIAQGTPVTLLGRFFTWTNMPNALTEMAEAPRIKLDLTNATQVCLGASIAVAGAAGADLLVQYSTDESAWSTLTSNFINVGATGTQRTALENIPAGAKADVFIRLVGQQGSGTADPQFRAGITLWVK